jgi:pyruvate dehydrogenase E2 component (dihydrolipoamide acetyltransferase)
MAHAILMPKPGQMTEECTLILWRKAEGEVVQRGDVLFEIETDKSAMEVECFDEGVLLRQVVAEGMTVPVNAICAWVGEAGEAITEVDPPVPMPAAETPVQFTAAPVTIVPGTVTGAVDLDAAHLRISPRASRLAASAGLDPGAIEGSGPEGRVTERDVATAIASAAKHAAPSRSPGPTPPRLAGADETVEPMSPMRRVIAERLTASWTTTPHFTITVTVDLFRLLALRTELKASGSEVSVTDLVLAGVAQTLVDFPELNTRIEGTDFIRRERVHLGLAVSVPRGLLVPVIRDAHLRSLTGIHERVQVLVAGARAGTLGPDELGGSTFTVSNLGMFGVDEFSAIINPGEAAILAVASAVPTPVAVGEGIAIHPIMKLTLSADHRVVDGETAARFLGALRRRLEDVEAFRRTLTV